MAKLRRFTVSGTGPFPVDMLRYDSCWPENESESWVIVACNRCDRDTNKVRRSISLRSMQEPTVARWESFGWRVDR